MVTVTEVSGAAEQAEPSRPLEVLIVTQAVIYGVAVYVRQLTEAAVAAGHSERGSQARGAEYGASAGPS